ncbi:TPA: hypothetical protein ACJGSF_002418 [Salmonella enterica subsp. enterica serovar Muenchen]|nr:hypothetical protein [Salmonella enterica]
MSRRDVPGLSELIYSLICEYPGILKHELRRMVHERQGMTITDSDLSDIIFCLKLYRGVFVMRGYGYFKNEEMFNYHRFGIIPGKKVRQKWRQFGNENNE